MKLSDCKFSENDIKQLQYYRDGQEDFRLKLRFMAILSVALNKSDIGVAVENAAAVFGKHTDTIKKWLFQYLTEGPEKVNSFNYKPKETYLNRYQINQVVIFVTYENHATVKEVMSYIDNEFSVSYSHEAVRQLLIKNGLKLLRPVKIPANLPSPEIQKKTVEKYEYMRKKTDSVILFVDVMHLIHQNFPGLCWGNQAFHPVAETNTGRKRLNIIGGYDPATYSLTHLTGEENCDAGRVIEYFELIYKKYSDYSEIYLIADNAEYFHAAKVSKWLDEHKKINIVFLTPYSPNLNLIERLWRFAKGKLVRNRYYKEYKTFRAKAFQFLNHVDEYVDELKTLMTEKFQIIYA